MIAVSDTGNGIPASMLAACSTRSSPRRDRARAPGSDFPWSTASSSSRRGTSRSTVRKTRARRSGCTCRRAGRGACRQFRCTAGESTAGADHSRGRGRPAGAQIRTGAAASRSATSPCHAANAAEALTIVQAASRIRPAVHRRDHARQDERPAARRRGASRHRIRVLFTSGYTENAIVHHGRLIPACCCWRSRIASPIWREMIRRALEGVMGERGAPAVRNPDARCAVITIRTRSAAFLAPSFFMMLAR